METASDNDIEVINNALDHLEPSDKEEIEKDLKEANHLQKKNKSITNFLRTHDIKKINLDIEENRKQYDKDIFLTLKKIKGDFVPLLKIYNILTDPKKCYMLKKYFVLKRNGEDEINNKEETQESNKPVITINLKPIYDDSQYYSNVVKGMMNFICSNFEYSKLKLYFDLNIFKENYGYYKNNSDAFKNSLLTFVGQIKENLDLYEKDKERFKENASQTEKIEEKKIAEKDFNDILVKADFAEDQTLLKIYEEAPGNQEIISRINELSMKKYSKIIIYMNEYTRYCAQINSLSAQVNEQKKDIVNLNKDKIDKDSKINNLNKDIENLKNDKIDKEAQINNLNTQVDNLNKDKIDKDKKIRAQEDKISNLQKKVDYMEVILNSLISRKVIKHCINQIINKYKSSIKMIKKTKTEANGEINEFFYIQVINNINSVPVKQSQELIDLLYEKKDIYNNCVHFVGKEKPFFIDDVWGAVINFLELTEENKAIFNKIITKDIKDSFIFSQKDIKIKFN